jgi:hypothetical protein
MTNNYRPSYYKRTMSDKDYYLSMANRPVPKNKFSKYRGVSKANNPNKPYRVCFKYKGKHYHIGIYADEIEAALAYNKAALAVIGPYAVLNDILGESKDEVQDLQ